MSKSFESGVLEQGEHAGQGVLRTTTEKRWIRDRISKTFVTMFKLCSDLFF